MPNPKSDDNTRGPSEYSTDEGGNPIHARLRPQTPAEKERHRQAMEGLDRLLGHPKPSKPGPDTAEPKTVPEQ